VHGNECARKEHVGRARKEHVERAQRARRARVRCIVMQALCAKPFTKGRGTRFPCRCKGSPHATHLADDERDGVEKVEPVVLVFVRQRLVDGEEVVVQVQRHVDGIAVRDPVNRALAFRRPCRRRVQVDRARQLHQLAGAVILGRLPRHVVRPQKPHGLRWREPAETSYRRRLVLGAEKHVRPLNVPATWFNAWSRAWSRA